MVRTGDQVVDATCGKGRDTLFLARLVQQPGRVWSFDIQREALEFTRSLLQAEGAEKQATLVHDNHSRADQYLPASIRAAMFNLGYMPGGDHDVITNGPDTVRALQHCVSRLTEGGIITVVAYPGHPGGRQEMQDVGDYLSSLDQQVFECWQLSFMNQRNQPPVLMVCTKRCGGKI